MRNPKHNVTVARLKISRGLDELTSAAYNQGRYEGCQPFRELLIRIRQERGISVAKVVEYIKEQLARRGE